jgi:hypothetical protein
MAAAELVIMPQAANAPVIAGTPAPAQANDGVQEQVRQTVREAQQGAQQAARDAARDAARTSKVVHVDKNGTVTIDGSAVFTPGDQSFTIPAGFDNSHLIPPQVVDIAIGFFAMCAVMVVGWPLARAFGRRIESRAAAPAAIPAAITDQLQRIEQAVDAMSVEVERISESQRFMAKLQQQSGGELMGLPRARGSPAGILMQRGAADIGRPALHSAPCYW